MGVKIEENIYPTGTCFDDCIDYLNDLAKENPSDIERMNKEYRVCHGICLLPSGEKYAHGWLEYRKSVIEGGVYKGEKCAMKYPKWQFYARVKPLKIVRYTIRMTLELERRVFGYCGPWDEEIRALCKDIKKGLLILSER